MSAAAAAAGCTGTISSPGGDATAAGPTGTSTPAGGGSAGVTEIPERTTPDGVGWATRFPKLSNEQWENTVVDLFNLETATALSGVYGSQSKDDRFGFDGAVLAPFLQQEARLFFDEIVADGGGIRALLTKPVAFVNAQTAPFYGLAGITGTDLQRVDLSDRAHGAFDSARLFDADRRPHADRSGASRAHGLEAGAV
ncbi:MAG TPA: DUF1592 domain-containing protein [Polyangiaceae bacterium]|nr:DUF1592 domain-containing protein [Polyangiaceae bacterium]